MKRLQALLLMLVIATGMFALAQEHPAPASSEPKAEQPAAEKASDAHKSDSPAQQLAHESKEVAEGEGTEAFKHSPTVRWVASKLGISPKAEFWILYSIDFLIIAALVVWVWRSSVPKAFRERTASIRKTMEEAQAASADANRRLGEIEGRLARLDQEIGQMKASADTEAAAEEARIRAAAEAESQKIIEAAQAEIESASRVAQRDLKAYAAELAVSLAEKKMRVDSDTDRQLVQRFSRDLAASGGKETR